jgi:hypothetical protein
MNNKIFSPRILIIAIAIVIIGSQLVKYFSSKDFTKYEMYHSAEGRYSILLPTDVNDEIVPLDTEFGETKIYLKSAKTKDLEYIIGYCDYPNEIINQNTPEEILDFVRDGGISGMQGELIYERKLDFHGFACREIKLKIPQKMFVKNRFYLIEHRAYNIMVVTSQEFITHNKVSDYFDSFQVDGIENMIPPPTAVETDTLISTK